MHGKLLSSISGVIRIWDSTLAQIEHTAHRYYASRSSWRLLVISRIPRILSTAAEFECVCHWFHHGAHSKVPVCNRTDWVGSKEVYGSGESTIVVHPLGNQLINIQFIIYCRALSVKTTRSPSSLANMNTQKTEPVYNISRCRMSPRTPDHSTSLNCE